MNTETQDPRKGSTSASNAQADELCKGRHLAQKGIKEEESDDASHGTEIHDALRKQDPSGLGVDQEKTYELCNAVVDHCLLTLFGPGAGAPPNIIRERRMWIRWGDGLSHSGQVDLAIIIGDSAFLADYKTLPGDVAESSKNMQLRDLAILLDVSAPGLNRIAVAPIQPLVTMRPEITVYTREHLDRAREELYFRVRASNDPNSPRTAGEAQCKFCLAKSSCNQYAAFAGTIAISSGSPIFGIPMSQWTPDMRAQFLRDAPVAERWLDTCKSDLKKLMKENPDAVTGFTLKPGQVREKITNPQGVFAAFRAIGGTQEQFMPAVSLTKAGLEEVIRKSLGLKGRAIADKLGQILEGNTEKSTTEPTIVAKK